MNNDVNQKLKKEADFYLEERGLRSILEDYGNVHIVGSYTLDLMVWGDLDVAVEVPEYDVRRHFKIGERILQEFNPHKLKFRNELINDNPKLPQGLYWGVHLTDGWKFDIWALTPDIIKKNLQFTRNLLERLGASNRKIILDIKKRVFKSPYYRNEIVGVDIYRAVLGKGVKSYGEFVDLMARKKGIDLNSKSM